MRSKKGYMRTFEAVLAILLSFLVMTFIIQSKSPTDVQKPELELALILQEDPQFRQCAAYGNISCMNNTLALHYPDFVRVYSYQFDIAVDPFSAPPDLPRADIHTESVFITGDNIYSYPRVVRLYYWDKGT